LKFTITPEFDPAYLLNFDIDKIEYKIPPPWLKSPTSRLNFTSHVCQKSILLSDSRVSEGEESTSRRSLARQLRLDSGV
jgi:hypothetical protein